MLWVLIRSTLQRQFHKYPQFMYVWRNNEKQFFLGTQTTLQPLYNMVHYNTVLDITRFKDGSQKCIDYIEK